MDKQQVKSPTSVLITNGNTMSMIALGKWLKTYGNFIKKVFITYKLPSSKSNFSGVWNLWRTSGFAYTYLKIWTNVILPRKLREKKLPSNVAEFIRSLDIEIPVANVDSVNEPTIVEEIADLSPDYLVSFSATQRFHAPLIRTPRIGAVNIHYGALPAYAGLSPYYWHLHNQEKEYGVTLHQIIEKLDAGPIIKQIKEPVGETKTCLQLNLMMADHVSQLLIDLFDGTLSIENVYPQTEEGRSYFKHPSKKQVAEFHANGYRMKDKDAVKSVMCVVENLT